jgi:drug/metabolite transporter (DMT)-like permease
MQNGNSLKGLSILLMTALIWGVAFVAQRSAMTGIGPFLFQGTRMVLGALTLSVVIAASAGLRRRSLPAKDGAGCPDGEARRLPFIDRHVISGGVVCGLVLFTAGSLQQVGLVTTTASKAAFLTAMYIVLVPVLGLFIRHKTHWNTWASVAIAVIGLYCLTMQGSFSIEPGDAITIVGAFFWACHILSIDHFVGSLEGVENGVMKLCVAQFIVAGVLSGVCAPFFDGVFQPTPLSLESVMGALPEILYVGVLSTGVAFTTQAIGQKYTKPSAASLVMSLEAVFGAIGGVLILGEGMTLSEIVGCILMFAAVMLTQIQIGGRKVAGESGGEGSQ